MKKIKDELKKKLKKKLVAYLDEWVWEGEYDRANTEDMVDDILNPKVFPEIAVVDRYAITPYSPDKGETEYTFAWNEATEEMLDEGWVKEVKE